MSDYSMADISSVLSSIGLYSSNVAKNSTSRKNNIDLDMTDFLQLMVVQLQSQTIDDTMDTSEMMNQMVQMQMITAITNMTETNIMTYASSLVGKEVTIGISDGTNLEERVITVIGTGTYDGQQVIFGSDGETYALNQIMAVGRLPEIEGVESPDEGTDPNPDVTNPGTTNPDVTNPGTTNPDITNPDVTDPGTTTEPEDKDGETGLEGGVDNKPDVDGNQGGDEGDGYDGSQGAPLDEV